MRVVLPGSALVLGCTFGCRFNPAGETAGDDADDAADDDPVIDVDAAPDDPTTTPLLCPAGYAPINDSETQYRIVEVHVTWAAAAADCNDDGDHTPLVVVGDPLEKAALTQQFSGNTWVGLTDAAQEGTFVWVTSEPTHGFPRVGEEPPWDGGDPDGGTDENCVRFKNSFDFEDKRCTGTNSYVCECDAYAPS
jgi:hypothetical protein